MMHTVFITHYNFNVEHPLALPLTSDQAVTTPNHVMIWQVNISARRGMILCTWYWRVTLSWSQSKTVIEMSPRLRLLSCCDRKEIKVTRTWLNLPCWRCSLWSYKEVWQSAFVCRCRFKGKGHHAPLLLYRSLLKCSQPMLNSIVYNLDKISRWDPVGHQ